MNQGLEKYYKILGLPNNASQEAIKKQYRKLVFIYHPDKPGGNEIKFIQITEAYDFLTGKKSLPPTSSSSRSTSTNAFKSKEERVKEAIKRQREQKMREQLENEKYFQQLTGDWKWKLIRVNAILGLICALMLCTEQFLPKHYKKDRLVAFSHQLFSVGQDNHVSFAKFRTTETAFIGNFSFSLYHLYPEGYFESSWFFHNPSHFVSQQGPFIDKHRIHFSIGDNYLIFVIILIVPFLTLLYKRKNFNFTVLFYLSFYICAPIFYYFLFTNDRWVHLLTFGFV